METAGAKDPEFKAAREAREAAGTSRYAAPVRADAPALNDTEELDSATVAALRARTCERVRRLCAKVAAEAARLAAAPATEPMSSPLVPDKLSEPAILDSAQPRAPKDNSVRGRHDLLRYAGRRWRRCATARWCSPMSITR